MVGSAKLGWRVFILSIVTCAPSGAQVWHPLPAFPELLGGQRYEDVFFLDANLGWVIRGSEIHRTKDGGTSWETLNHSYLGSRSVVFVDSLNGWIGGIQPGSSLFSTTDGGKTVEPIPFPDEVGICGLSAPTPEVIYGCGRYYGPAFVVKSTDAGESWTTMDLSHLASRLIECHFISADSGFVFGGNDSEFGSSRALILSTSDGGNKWEVRHLNRTVGRESWCWKASFPTMQTGYASVESFGGRDFILKTTDGGATWSEVQVSPAVYQQGIGFATETLGWLGGGGALALETSDGGVTWSSASFGKRVNSFHMLTPDLGYAVGAQVFKYSKETAVGKASFSDIKALYR